MVAVLTFAGLTSMHVNAAIKTWTGGGINNNWSTGANWQGGVAPVNGDSLVFAGTTRLINNNDIPGLSVQDITFNATAGPFILNGNSIDLSGGMVNNISNNDTDLQTINFSIFIVSTINFNTTPGNILVNGVIGVSAGGAGLTKNGTGMLTLAGSNLYSGPTKINDGTIQLGAAERINDLSNMILNGGTFSTGATTGYKENVNTLQLADNSIIDFGTEDHILRFNSSNGVSWTAGKTLTIIDWQGAWNGSHGTDGKLYVGTNANRIDGRSIEPGPLL